MFRIKSFVVVLLALAAVSGLSQSASAPAAGSPPSQKATVMQTIGVTDVSVVYSRPGVKGRTIWGDAPADSYAKGESTLDDQNKRPAGMPIVPYGHVWHTGANEATQFIVTDDVLINGQKLAAGSYSLHTVPGKDEWTIVFNNAANQWGSFDYDPSKDTLRVKAKPAVSSDPQEWLAFTIDPTKDNAAVVNIRWEKIRVPFTVEVADVVATTIARAREAVAASKDDDWRTPFQAAGYANQNKAGEDAKKWLDLASARVDASIAKKETFQNLSAKTNMLLAAGKKDEAFAVADRAIALGKADKVDTAAFEKRIAELKASK